MRILIVEDDVIPANYLKKILELEGHAVVGMAGKGADAIEMAREKRPDVIFMDIMLKDSISGAEAAREIHYKNADIMIIFLTAYSDKEMIEYAIESDAFAYLLKPYRDREILATLELARSKLETLQTLVREDNQNDSLVALVDGYCYNMKLKRLFLDNVEVSLGAKALQLVDLLCKNKHITLEIEMILENLWETPKSGQTLRSLIHRIRETTSPELIQNSSRFGYKIGLRK